MADRKDLKQQIAALEAELTKSRQGAVDAERLLDELEGKRAELEGRLTVSRQATADFEARLEIRRRELNDAVRAEAIAAVSEAIAARDVVAARAANLLHRLVSELETLDNARADVETRIRDVESIDGARIEPRPEPDDFAAEWARLLDVVRAREQLRLENDLIEAAARSPLGHEIQNLPQHLQALARRRRAEQLSTASRRSRGNDRDAG